MTKYLIYCEGEGYYAGKYQHQGEDYSIWKSKTRNDFPKVRRYSSRLAAEKALAKVPTSGHVDPTLKVVEELQSE